MKNIRRSAIEWAAPGIMVLTLLFHMYMVHMNNLTHWKGGGFGMFSTLDRLENRFVRCYVVDREKLRAIQVPEEMRDQMGLLRAIPKEDRLRRFADDLMGLVKSEYGWDGPVLAEVWNYRFDATKARLQAYPMFRAGSGE